MDEDSYSLGSHMVYYFSFVALDGIKKVSQMTVSSWFSLHIDEKLDAYYYLYVGYMYELLKLHIDKWCWYKRSTPNNDQEIGVITGFMKIWLFGDMAYLVT